LSDKESRICEELRAKETDTRCFRVINAYCRRLPFGIEHIIHPILTIHQVTSREPDNLSSYKIRMLKCSKHYLLSANIAKDLLCQIPADNHSLDL
jgi:hypothetical protein